MHIKIALIACLSLLFVACSKVTVENYDKIKVGMKYEEIVQVLGKPDQCSDVLGVKNCVWGDEQRNINVSFVADQAVVFSAHNIR